jgi:aerobic-type carbon monoxide dehydrogenase small subunit (CoxS/CutS family)
MADAIELEVNGATRSVDADPTRTLLSILRDELDLTGTKYGCGEGQCGACTVLLDGNPTRSCITSLRAAAGKKITTIEGLAKEGRLHPLQEAFLAQDAMQCAYCTPGMVMSSLALLRKNPEPTREQIIQAMEGNICRCGTYARIVSAIDQAARSMRASHP